MKNFTAAKNNFNIVQGFVTHLLTHYLKPGISGLFFAHHRSASHEEAICLRPSIILNWLTLHQTSRYA